MFSTDVNRDLSSGFTVFRYLESEYVEKQE